MATDSLVSVRRNSYKWHASPVTTYQGTLEQVQHFVPNFERCSFGPRLLPVEGGDSPFAGTRTARIPGYNYSYDVIVRQPLNSSQTAVPVGIVSKQYTLVQHQLILNEARKVIAEAGVPIGEVKSELDLTEYGEKMRLSILFPERFNLNIDGREKMGLRLECFNSVDGSMRFMAVIGWLRFVCLNGMIIGVADSYYRRRHNQYMELSDIAAILKGGIEATTRERDVYRTWMTKSVSEEKLMKWVNGPLAKSWGVKAAARTWHIARSGRDAKLVDPFEKGKPTDKSYELLTKVPGAVLPGNTVFAVSQALSWLAKERRDVQEQLEWKQQAGELVNTLLKAKGT